MYDELVKALRGPYDTRNDIWLMKQAADAIESLSEDNAALNGTIENLLEQIKDLGKPNWIPVTERLPEKSCKCLVYTERGEYGGYDITTYNSMTMTFLDYEIGCEKVTHWMPLPPPKEE